MHKEPLFYVFGNAVYAYGICMAAGILLCFGFLLLAMHIKKFNEAATDRVLIIGLFGTGFGIFCAALFQSVYNYIADPSKPFKLDGMTFLGGLIGGVASFLAVWNLYVYVVAPRTKIKWLKNNMNAGLSDALPFIPIAICIAHAFGRFGCFWAGCCYGAPAEWGLPCSQYDDINRIPTQLIEMGFLLGLAGIMALLYFKYKFNYNFGLYAICYAIFRFVIEFYRDDYRGGVDGALLSPSQIQSIIMLLIGVGYFFLQYYVLAKLMKHPELQAVTSELVPVEGETVIIVDDGLELITENAEKRTEELKEPQTVAEIEAKTTETNLLEDTVETDTEDEGEK